MRTSGSPVSATSGELLDHLGRRVGNQDLAEKVANQLLMTPRPRGTRGLVRELDLEVHETAMLVAQRPQQQERVDQGLERRPEPMLGISQTAFSAPTCLLVLLRLDGKPEIRRKVGEQLDLLLIEEIGLAGVHAEDSERLALRDERKRGRGAVTSGESAFAPRDHPTGSVATSLTANSRPSRAAVPAAGDPRGCMRPRDPNPSTYPSPLPPARSG